MEFLEWWNLIGSGIRPLPGEDMEEHSKFIAFMAWEASKRNEQTKQEKQS